jgi:prolyl-tRNA synthetase
MTHSDDSGLVLPPKLAPLQVVVVPIWHSDDEKTALLERIDVITRDWSGKFRFKVDDRENYRPGWKFNEWEKQGVPVRVELGPKDLAKSELVVVRRDSGDKTRISWNHVDETLSDVLDSMQKDLYQRALTFREHHSHIIDDYEELKQRLDEEGGFYWVHWNGKRESEDRLQEETKATIRVIPDERSRETGKCIFTGEPSSQRVIVAKGY